MVHYTKNEHGFYKQYLWLKRDINGATFLSDPYYTVTTNLPTHQSQSKAFCGQEKNTEMSEINEVASIENCELIQELNQSLRI